MCYSHKEMKFLEKSKLPRQEKHQWLPGIQGEGGMNRQSTENFYVSESTLYDTIMVDTCHYTFVLTHEMYNTKTKQ